MFFVFCRKVYEKDRLAAFLSCFSGFIFFLGQVYYLTANFSLENLFSQFQKITFQANLLAFIVSTLYLFNPKHLIFENNYVMIISIVILLFAGLGFWILLFPVYFIELKDYLVSREQLTWYRFSAFYVFWNHAVTQFFFLIMFYYSVKKSSSDFLYPVSKKLINLTLIFYMISWIILNIISSFWDKTFPVYGIMTNFNWNTERKIYKSEFILFDFKILFLSHFICFLILFSIGNYFQSVSKQFYISNFYKYSEPKI